MDQEYIEIKQKIEAELNKWLPSEPDKIWTEKVFGEIGKNTDTESIKAMLAPIRELVFRGGKRWRPLFMSLVCQTLGGGDAAIHLAPAVEFAHNACLIHDDIEDESDERRGKPTIHKIHGTDVALNSGSFFYFLSAICVDSYVSKDKEFIYKFWTENIRRFHLGQSMDIGWHQDITIVPKIDDYYFMCSLKTGSFARLAAGLGAHAAGASEKTINLIGDAAEKMGIGYQIIYDVKNLTTNTYGKKRGEDITEGKKCLPILLFLDKYPEKREKIFYFFHAAKSEGSSAPEVEELIDTLTPAGVFEEAEEIGRAFLQKTRYIINSDDFTGFSKDEKSFALLDGFFSVLI